MKRSRSSPAARSTKTRSSRSRKPGRDIVAEQGDDTPIEWIGRDRRYGEKLATPDITIADLIGEVDPIKVAEGRYLSDELTIHYGLIPRTNRGIFCINELPDLAERIQVGLFNIMEERDVQIRGYRIRLPLDVFVVVEREPGGLHQPRPHHHAAQGPLRRADPHALPDAGRARDRHHGRRSAMRFDDADYKVVVPQYMKEIVAEISRLARRSPDVNQRSGVSVRASIANYESLLANALRRAISTGENEVVPRVSDLPYVIPAISGQGRVRDGRRRQGRADHREADPGRRASRCSTATSASPSFEDVVTRFKSGISRRSRRHDAVRATTSESSSRSRVSSAHVAKVEPKRIAGGTAVASSSSSSKACT